jgi:DNA processing protein
MAASHDSELSRAQAFLVLNHLPGMGPVTLKRLLDRFEKDPRAVLRAPRKRLLAVRDVGEVLASALENWPNHVDLAREEARITNFDARFVPVDDPDYPGALHEIYDPPIGLHWKGDYKRCELPMVALVGSRRATLYGLRTARQLASQLARLGFCVVSGMARGIDTAAHEGALEVGGKTIALFGCGIDVVYPPENRELYERIQASGAILSEFPMGWKASKTTFPMRNRIIAGLCRAVVIVETDLRGGSMITAKFAADQNRSVFAVPGRIDQPSSRGCHALIREGATLLTCADELVEELNYRGQTELALGPPPLDKRDSISGPPQGPGALPSPEAPPAPSLSEAEARVLGSLSGGGILPLDAIVEQSGLASHEVASTLMLLELKRRVAKHADGCFEAV